MSGTGSVGSSEHEIPDGHIASAASQFRNGASILLRELESLASSNRIGDFNCALPLLMMSGFALELYLKSLNARLVFHDLADEMGIPGTGFRVTSQSLRRGHELISLYDAIDEAIRNALEQEYASSPAIPRFPTFREALEPYSRIFENARYIFENDRTLPQGGPRDLMVLVRFVGAFVESMPRRRLVREEDA